MKECHRVNLMELRAAVEAQPCTQFTLDAYRGYSASGRAFCMAGMVGYLPHFRQQGVFPDPVSGAPVMHVAGAPQLNTRATLDRLFGPFARDGQALFAMYGQGAWDRHLLELASTLPSHKALAMARLEHAMRLVVQDERCVPQAKRATMRADPGDQPIAA